MFARPTSRLDSAIGTYSLYSIAIRSKTRTEWLSLFDWPWKNKHSRLLISLVCSYITLLLRIFIITLDADVAHGVITFIISSNILGCFSSYDALYHTELSHRKMVALYM